MRVLMLLLIVLVAGLAVFAREWAADAQSYRITETSNHTTTAAEQRMSDTEPLITEIVVGEGAQVSNGETAVVHYTGWLYDAAAPERKGSKFDSSHDHGEPFEFEVGAGHVIRGWDLGVAGMKVGGKRRLVVPSELGYGARGAGGVIPGGATLVFDVELVGVQ